MISVTIEILFTSDILIIKVDFKVIAFFFNPSFSFIKPSVHIFSLLYILELFLTYYEFWHRNVAYCFEYVLFTDCIFYILCSQF